MSAGFSQRLSLAQLGAARPFALSADAAEREAIAQRLGLLGIARLDATLTLSRDGEEVRARGRLAAEVTQACVASGEPVPARIDEGVDLIFRPHPTTAPDEEIELGPEDGDVVFHDGREIDLGAALGDELALALDPYPRGANAAEALRDAGVLSEEQAGPFAALAALKGK